MALIKLIFFKHYKQCHTAQNNTIKLIVPFLSFLTPKQQNNSNRYSRQLIQQTKTNQLSQVTFFFCYVNFNCLDSLLFTPPTIVNCYCSSFLFTPSTIIKSYCSSLVRTIFISNGRSLEFFPCLLLPIKGFCLGSTAGSCQ